VILAAVLPKIFPSKRYAIQQTLSFKREVWGIDLSHHQRSVDWDEVATASPDFVFVKATEGTTHKDTKFEENWEKLEDLNICRGAYHFFSYRSDGKTQAENFIASVKLRSGDLPPVLDAEFKRRMWDDDKITQEIMVWLKMVEDHYNVTPIIYTDERYYKRYLQGKISDKYPLWIVNYKNEPELNWTFWQHTDSYKINGVKGTVDRNVFHKGSTAFSHFLIP
jgi:lysozyme